jgi:5S rRNA maturation endonuclease (ribonuclease M5)
LYSNRVRKEYLKKLIELLNQIEYLVDVVLVEGLRDLKSLRNLGYSGEIVYCNQKGVSDYDLTDKICQQYNKVLILTDYDKEGEELEQHFRELFERKAIKVENGLRREVGRITAKLRVHAIESLDNIQRNLVNS